jgi:hypothetical protein
LIGSSAAAGVLVRDGRFDPGRFVDFVESAVKSRNADLVHQAERIQWLEMIRLLEATWRDATAGD